MNTSAMDKKKRSFVYFLYIAPFVALVLVFSYYPLYGWVYSFFDYNPPYPLSLENFVGFKWFVTMVSTPARRKALAQVLANTFAINGLNMAFSWFPMVFAIFLSEIRNKRYKKLVQTITTLPNFISWVLVYAIAFSVLNSTGVVNTLLMDLGVTSKPIMFLQSSKNVWVSMFLWGMWKGVGWNAIMYMAAISGIDEQLIEAARLDGAGKLQTIWHITLPSLLPTYLVLLMLSIASFLNNGMEQFYVFQNSFNANTIQVLDLYVYNLAMGSGGYSLSTAISMFKSLISVILLCGTNSLAKRIRGDSMI